MFNKATLFGGSFTKVYKPTITSPTASQIVGSRTPTITSSAFSKYGNITHASTDWQVSDASDFNTIRWSSSNDTSNKISIISSDLAGGDRYVRVRHKASNGVYSDWSDAVLFTSPWASGASGVFTNSTSFDVETSGTVTLQAGTYRINLWGGGGGGATGGGRGGSNGGGSGSVYKDVLYNNETNVSFTVGTYGVGGTQSGSGNGGSPGGGAGLNIGNGSWNGGGGGGYTTSSTLGITAAGGGGGGADNGSSGNGSPGGSGTGSEGYEWTSISSSGSKTGGFSISNNYDTNFSRDTGCSLSGTYSCSFSFGNMQGKKINVKLVASGDSGTQETEYSCCDGSGSLSLSFNGDYRNIAVYYQWCGSGAADITTNLSVSWSGTGANRLATAGSSGGGGGGGGCVSNGAGSSGGNGGSNSGSYTQSYNGSGSDAGNRYYYSSGGYYFGDGGSGENGKNGGVRIQKI
jgi:hypothetical protein